jgi:hypothetical protein
MGVSMMMAQRTVPLDKPFQEMPKDFREYARQYFFKMMPLMAKDWEIVRVSGAEASLEAFEEMVEDGGIRFIKDPNGNWRVWLFNLFSRKYEDATTLYDDYVELEEDDDEDTASA